MNSPKEFLINNGEKVFFGLVLAFSIYSILGSVTSILSGSGDLTTIRSYEKEIESGVNKEATDKALEFVSIKEDILLSCVNTDHIATHNKVIVAKLFSEKTTEDPYKNVQDIINGHSSSSAAPEENCRKYFAKVNGNDVCIVCGSIGEKVYIYKPAILTDLKTLSANTQKVLKSNPFVDRKSIRIIWEDNILSDRTNYKDRVAQVYRLEVDDKKISELNSFVGKPQYQKSVIDFVKKYKLTPQVGLDNKRVMIKPDFISEDASIEEPKNPGKEKRPEEEPGSLFGPEKKKDVVVKNNTVKNKNLNKLFKEKVFYKYEDNKFEPLKKYMYILVIQASGKSATGTKIKMEVSADPVIVTTNAENVFFLTKVIEKKDKPGEYQASFQIYQYFKAQNVFYKMVFNRLELNDSLGEHSRKSSGEKSQLRNTKIYKKKLNAKNQRVPLKGTDLTDSVWKVWRNSFPTMKRRKDSIAIKLKYATGFKIIKIGIEKNRKVINKIKWINKLDKDGKQVFDENGKPVKEKKEFFTKRATGFVELQNTLTKEKKRIYEEKTNNIKIQLIERKINTIGN